MQLRVARLCIDCEELHNADRCPLCASESYAFLASWLPSEERRRFRRAPPAPANESWWSVSPRDLWHALGRWLAGEPREVATNGPATRAADRASQWNFNAKNEPALDGDLGRPLPTPGVRKA